MIMRCFCVAVLAVLCLSMCVSGINPRYLCGKMIHRDHNGVILSHSGFGKSLYGTAYSCLWRIQAPPLHRIHVLIPSLSIEYDAHCGFDHLDIYDDINASNQTKLLARLCGHKTNEYVSSGAYITLRWVSDLSVTKSGFLIRYMFVPNTISAQEILQARRSRCASKITCNDGFCVPTKFVCDGINDCQDKRDEQNCPGATTTPKPTTLPPTTPSTTVTTTATSATTPSTQQTTTASTSTQAPTPGSCGAPKILPDEDESRVVGGKVAISGSWPWTVSLRYNGGHICGGSIIAPQWVLTAAHCVSGYSSASAYTIVAGLHQETGNAGTQTIRVQRIVIHPNWNSQATDYDYTLLYLSSKLTYTDRIGPICLPSTVLGGAVGCFVAGWGDTKGTGGAGFLKQAFVKTFTHTECTGFYGGITTRMICAGHREGGRDTCQGDSGGPLMCKVNGKWELHGATSFGGECAAPNSPGVYARITTAVTWIKAQAGL